MGVPLPRCIAHRGVVSLPPVHPLAAILLFFFHDTPTTEIYTLSLHDALPISRPQRTRCGSRMPHGPRGSFATDRKSTRLNSSHRCISYAVFCLKKKKAGQGRARHGGLAR